MIIKGYTAARGDFLKLQIGDIGPALKGRTRQNLASGSEPRHCISDDVVGAHVSTATTITTEARGQEIRDFIKRIGGWCEFND